MRVVREIEKAGRKAFEVTSPCEGVSSGYLSSSDQAIDSLYNGDWWRYLALPPAEGTEWLEFRAKAFWHEIGKVTVPAGTFDHCWRKVRRVVYDDWSDYCEGTGLVRSKMKDLAGGFIRMELVR
jgi:hypothetical protein